MDNTKNKKNKGTDGGTNVPLAVLAGRGYTNEQLFAEVARRMEVEVYDLRRYWMLTREILVNPKMMPYPACLQETHGLRLAACKMVCRHACGGPVDNVVRKCPLLDNADDQVHWRRKGLWSPDLDLDEDLDLAIDTLERCKWLKEVA